jgi:hypothetical protein
MISGITALSALLACGLRSGYSPPPSFKILDGVAIMGNAAETIMSQINAVVAITVGLSYNFD